MRIIKQILSVIIEPYVTLPWKSIGDVLFWSLRLYSFVLIPYITIILFGLMFMLLTGTGYLYGIVDFTRAYFYDGYFIFITWRIHLVFFISCVLSSINEELK